MYRVELCRISIYKDPAGSNFVEICIFLSENEGKNDVEKCHVECWRMSNGGELSNAVEMSNIV